MPLDSNFIARDCDGDRDGASSVQQSTERSPGGHEPPPPPEGPEVAGHPLWAFPLAVVRGAAALMRMEIDLRLLPREEAGPLNVAIALAILSCLAPGVGVPLWAALLAYGAARIFLGQRRDIMLFTPAILYALCLAVAEVNFLVKVGQSWMPALDSRSASYMELIAVAMVASQFLGTVHRIGLHAREQRERFIKDQRASRSEDTGRKPAADDQAESVDPDSNPETPTDSDSGRR